MNKCITCNHEFGPFEHYVRVGKVYICEQCFWEAALKKLNAEEVKNDYKGLIDEDYGLEIDYDSEPPVEYVNTHIIDLELDILKDAFKMKEEVLDNE